MKDLADWTVVEGGPMPGVLVKRISPGTPSPTEEEQRTLAFIKKEVEAGNVRVVRPLTLRECIAQGCTTEESLDYLERAMPHVVLWRGFEIMRIDPDKVTEAAG